MAILEIISGNNITKLDRLFAPVFVNHYILSYVSFDGHCVINTNISIQQKVKGLHIFYILNSWLRNLYTGFTLNICLLVSVELTKNMDPEK